MARRGEDGNDHDLRLAVAVVELAGDVRRHRLDNGLTVLVCARPGTGLAASLVWVKTGYFHERDSEVGISHVLEHTLFNGTPSRPEPDRFAREIKALGGTLNAATYYDYTSYHVLLPAASFLAGMAIQADALREPSFDADTLAVELGAIVQEVRRKQDDPEAYAREQLYAVAFREHPIRRWRMGEETELRRVTRADLSRTYRARYRPDNMILTLVGDFAPERALAGAREHFGAMEPGATQPVCWSAEPPPDGPRHRRLHGDLRRARWHLAFRGPGVGHPDRPPLEVLAAIVGDGWSSRLHRRLREQLGLVDTIEADYMAVADVGLLVIGAGLEATRLVDAQEAVAEELARIADHGVGADEVDRVARRTALSSLERRGDVLGRASLLARFEADGDYRAADAFIRDLCAVSTTDVVRVARTYLDPRRAALLEYVPDSMQLPPPTFAPLARHLGRGAAESGTAATSAGAAPSVVRAAPSEPDPAVRASRHETVLANGTRLVAYREPSRPTVAIGLFWAGGRSAETASAAGLAQLAHATLVKGSRELTAAEVAERIERLGCRLQTKVAEDYVGLWTTALAPDRDAATALLCELVRAPAFAAEEIERERELALAAVRRLEDDSFAHAWELYRSTAFPGHPYALPTYGTEATLRSFTREDAVQWHRRTLDPRTLVVVAVGDVDPDAFRRRVEAELGDVDADRVDGATPAPVPPARPGTTRTEQRSRQQTAQVVGWRTVAATHPDRFPLELISAFAGGLSGRFFEEIRGRRGLAYTVSTFQHSLASAGCFAVYLATGPDAETTARGVLLEQAAQLCERGARDDEVERARRFLVGSHRIRLQSRADRMLAYARAELLGPGPSFVDDYPQRIEAVGASEVLRCSRAYLDPSAHTAGIYRGR